MEPTLITIFGSTGDLTRRKLIPALFSLHQKKLLDRFAILGITHTERTDEQFRRSFSIKGVPKKEWAAFTKSMFCVHGDFKDASTYQRIAERAKEIEKHAGAPCNMLFYLSTPPAFFGEIAMQLRNAGLAEERTGCWRRLVIEKPFGHDLGSATQLNDRIMKTFREDQVFRIDHYLGKELVRNILVMRFANSVFENLLNKNAIDHVQISVLEDLGVEERAGYYDKTGALRDMAQSHLLQVLALLAMDPPASLEADDIREEKIKVLRALELPDTGKGFVVSGQYGPGKIAGKAVPGYRQEIGRRSDTETFVAMKLGLHNLRWGDIPFYLRTGKRLATRRAEINIVFKQLPCVLFCELPQSTTAHNVLTIRIQPESGILLTFNAKTPGPDMRVQPQAMEFCHACEFGPSPEAYEQLLHDAMRGDATLFTSWEEIRLSWRFIDRITRLWKRRKPAFPNYPAGSSGPDEADALLRHDNRFWINPRPKTPTKDT